MTKLIKFKKNLVFKRIFFLIILLITLYIIFSFSAQNGEEASYISQKVTEFIVEVISKIKSIDIDTRLYYIQKLDPIIRNFAHFVTYAIVGFSSMGFMCTFDMRNIYKGITSFGIGVIYAITDEIHQYFIQERSSEITDVFIDCAGVLTGIFLIIALIVLLEKIENRFKKVKYERKNVKCSQE